jgi:hypothetical protein
VCKNAILIIKVNTCAPKWTDTMKNQQIPTKMNKYLQKRVNIKYLQKQINIDKNR